MSSKNRLWAIIIASIGTILLLLYIFDVPPIQD